MSMGDDWPRVDEPLENARIAARRRVVIDEEIDRRLRRRFYWWISLGAVILVFLGILAYRSWYVTPDPDPALVGAVDVLRQQVESLGQEPAVPPAEDITDADTNVVPIPGPEGEQGEQGKQGERGLAGRPGRDGRDGAPCAPSNPQCIGPVGDTGATGDQGPGPSADQVAAAVTANCGGSCVGASGADGDDGADGAQGASIVAARFEPQDGRCLLIFTTRDPITGVETDLSPVEVPHQFCPPPAAGLP